MKSIYSARSVALIVLLIILLTMIGSTIATFGKTGGPAVDEKAVLKFRLVQDFGVIVPVFINGQGPYDFLLDTGTTSTVIRPELANALRLRAVDRLMLTTVTGSQAVPRSYLESVTLGSRSAANVEVLWQDLSAVRSLDNRISGLLGQNFLSQFNYLLSYREKRIVFEQKDELKNQMRGVAIPVEHNEGMIVVTAQSPRHSDKNVHLVLDSGSAGLMFFAGVCDRAGFEFRKSERSQLLSTDAGDRGVTSGMLGRIMIGNKTLFDLPVVVLGNERRSQDGILPTNLFDRVYFNNSDKYVILDR
jgi:predicted aspartyl protease